jgi:transmembrane sensor
MQLQDYSQFTLSDFLEDDFFIRWIMEPDPQSTMFWEAFMQRYPEKREAVMKASAIIKAYRKQKTFTNDDRQLEVWGRIQAEVQQAQIRQPARVVPLYTKIAAAAALFVVATSIFWLFADHRSVVSTAYNEVTKIVLPDRSVVMLNGNSTLRYNEDWNNDGPREVWIDGEAYFKVKHVNQDTLNIQPGERFIVHSNDLDIEVLGTSFNVQNRSNKTNITLLTGKVKVQLTEPAATRTPDVIMLPGDYVEYASKKLVAKKKLENPKWATTWIKQEILFTDALLKEIVKSLEEDYGYVVEVKDQKLMDLRIEGEISVSSVDELLTTVSATLGVRISRPSDKRIIMSKL